MLKIKFAYLPDSVRAISFLGFENDFIIYVNIKLNDVERKEAVEAEHEKILSGEYGEKIQFDEILIA